MDGKELWFLTFYKKLFTLHPMNEILYVDVSGNSKVGPIPVSGSLSSTCPATCPFAPKDGKANGCYAAYGPLSWTWRKLNNGGLGMEWVTFVGKIKKLWRGEMWRHNQFGDLAGVGNKIDLAKLRELIAANRGKLGYTYTHKPVLTRQDYKVAYINRKAVKEANDGGFAVNLSANNPAHADELAALNIGPVVSVIPSDSPNTSYTPQGRKIIACPAGYRDDVTCLRCKLCTVINRSVIVGFKAHGMGAKYVQAEAVRA